MSYSVYNNNNEICRVPEATRFAARFPFRPVKGKDVIKSDSFHNFEADDPVYLQSLVPVEIRNLSCVLRLLNAVNACMLQKTKMPEQ